MKYENVLHKFTAYFQGKYFNVRTTMTELYNKYANPKQ